MWLAKEEGGHDAEGEEEEEEGAIGSHFRGVSVRVMVIVLLDDDDHLDDVAVPRQPTSKKRPRDADSEEEEEDDDGEEEGEEEGEEGSGEEDGMAVAVNDGACTWCHLHLDCGDGQASFHLVLAVTLEAALKWKEKMLSKAHKTLVKVPNLMKVRSSSCHACSCLWSH